MSTPEPRPCPFCKIVKGEAPSFMIGETELSYAFLALPPLLPGHALVVPKVHAAKMHELEDAYLADAMMLAKDVARRQGLVNYNLIQNNGRIANQSVDHVHFHVINKPDEGSGLMVKWPMPQEDLQRYLAETFEEHGAVGKTPYTGW